MSYQFYQFMNIKKFKIRFQQGLCDNRKRSIIIYESDLQSAKVKACEKTDHQQYDIIECRRI